MVFFGVGRKNNKAFGVVQPAETIARRDAGIEPPWMDLRRVSDGCIVLTANRSRKTNDWQIGFNLKTNRTRISDLYLYSSR
jgi:hypothetical protein